MVRASTGASDGGVWLSIIDSKKKQYWVLALHAFDT
jgi:hypothetical protein